jgi:predicted transcriptional regulator
MAMDTLFPVRQDFHVVRITEEDAARTSDLLRLFDEQLSLNDEMYPRIRKWFWSKVVPGIRDGSRVAYLGFEGNKPSLTAIVKKGENAKFCHLRVAEELQDFHLGEVFFSMMALEVRTTAREIHFTLPESLWERRRKFFAGFGFREVALARTQYRLFEEELRTSASYWDVWRAARQRLPKLTNYFSINNYSMSPRLLLSIKPKLAKLILTGQKLIEIRRRFNGRWHGARVALYASSPERALVGEATIGNIKAANPQEIWHEYCDQIGCSHEEFLAYTGSSEEIYALQLQDVTPYASRMPVCQFEHLLEEELRPPQSHCEIHENHVWGKAVSIAALLHGCQRSTSRGLQWI